MVAMIALLLAHIASLAMNIITITFNEETLIEEVSDIELSGSYLCEGSTLIHALQWKSPRATGLRALPTGGHGAGINHPIVGSIVVQ